MKASGKSICDVVRAFIPRPTNPTQVYRAVFAYLLRVEDHHYFDRAMKAEGFDADGIKTLKDEFKYSWYVQDFWRGVLLYLRAMKLDRIRRYHRLDSEDLNAALTALSDDQFAALLNRAAFISTHCLDRDILCSIISRAENVCRAASYKLRWISKVDSAFNGFDELQLEAIRVALFYSWMPDPRRVMAYVIKAIYNRADHLAKYHSKPDRGRAQKMPEFRCGDCAKEFMHHKHVLSARQAVEKFGAIPPLQAGCPFFCPACAKKGKLSPLTTIWSEREFKTTVLSMDGASAQSADRRSMSDTISDPTQDGVEVSILHFLGDQALSGRISREASRFMRILLHGDDEFESWAMDTGLILPDDPNALAPIICQYIGTDYTTVQMEIGRPIRPSVYHVRVGDEDDMVCAHTPRAAVDCVARAYKFVDGMAMRAQLNEPVRVRCIDPFQKRYPSMVVGEVIPMKE